MSFDFHYFPSTDAEIVENDLKRKFVTNPLTDAKKQLEVGRLKTLDLFLVN